MSTESLAKFWPLIYSIIQEFWSLTEPHIEDSAIHNDIPIELYLYGELGSSNYSIKDFQKRDPFTNTDQFEKVLTRLNVKGWIEPLSDGSYRVTHQAREGVRHIVRMGDTQLLDFNSMPDGDLERLIVLLKQIVAESKVIREPPEKWGILVRFRVADEHSPLLVQIKEYLLDLFAYRDDSHLSAARPIFNEAGIVWLVLGSLWHGDAISAEQMGEKFAFRGYDVNDYEIAIQAAIEVGWIEEADHPNSFRPSAHGKELRERAENLTDEYFYAPWSVLTAKELVELHNLLTKLRDELIAYRKSR